jgi:hypothetical protein
MRAKRYDVVRPNRRVTERRRATKPIQLIVASTSRTDARSAKSVVDDSEHRCTGTYSIDGGGSKKDQK